MATGYTAVFEDRDVPFAEFIWRCARAMGSFIHMRDDGLDAEIRPPQPDLYHKDALVKAKEELKKYQKMSEKEASNLLAAEQKSHKEFVAEVTEKRTKLLDRYSRMLGQVTAWIPPSDNHVKFKEFMIQQLESSIKFDCDLTYYQADEKDKLSPKEWLKGRIAYAKRDIEYHTKRGAESEASTKEVMSWVAALEKSVPMPKKKK